MSETWKDFFRQRRRELLFLVSAGLAVVALFLLVGLFYEGGGEGYIPPEYTQAREETAKMSAEIVQLGEEINQTLLELATKDSIGDHEAALVLAEKGRGQIERLGKKAQKLLSALESMVSSVERVRPVSAVGVGKDAVTVGIKMVERLVVYSNLSSNLVQTIETKLGGGDVANKDIQELIGKINEEVRFVNSLSANYKALTERFDGLVGGGK
jgi:hypothetical protein